MAECPVCGKTDNSYDAERCGRCKHDLRTNYENNCLAKTKTAKPEYILTWKTNRHFTDREEWQAWHYKSDDRKKKDGELVTLYVFPGNTQNNFTTYKYCRGNGKFVRIRVPIDTLPVNSTPVYSKAKKEKAISFRTVICGLIAIAIFLVIFFGIRSEVNQSKKTPNESPLDTKSNEEIYLPIESKSRLMITLDSGDGLFSDGRTALSTESSVGDSYGDIFSETPTRPGYSFVGWYTEDSILIDESCYVTAEKNHTLYARWIPNGDILLTVNHYLMTVEGDSYNLFETQTYTAGDVNGTDLGLYLQNLTGFTFYGANYKEDESAFPNESNFVSELDISPGGGTNINIFYTRNKYSVFINGESDKAEVTGIGEYYYGTEVTVACSPSKGYEFSKWTINNSEESTLSEYTFAMPADNVYLEAIVKGKRFTVSFDTQGGSAIDSVKVTHGGEYKLSDIPTKQGYSFVGWFTKASGGKQITSGDPVKTTSNLTLYAHWEAGTKITYKVNHYQMDTTGSGYSLYLTETKTGKAEEKINTSSLAKTYTGFKYSGACAGTKASSKPGNYVETSSVLPDGTRVINLYYSRKQYEVSLTKSSGVKKVTGAGKYYFGETVVINCTLSDGYEWSKWSGTYSSKKQKYTFTMPASAIEMKASAIGLNYKLSFNPNGGTVSESYRSVATGTQFGDLPVANRNYYQFDGWYTAKEGGEKITSKTKMGSTDITVYAHWSPIATPTPEPTWSAWTTDSSLYGNSSYYHETYTETQYRYRDRSTTTSSNSSMPGWNLYNTDTTWNVTTEWTENVLVANDSNEKVETQIVQKDVPVTKYVYTNYYYIQNGTYYNQGHYPSGWTANTIVQVASSTAWTGLSNNCGKYNYAIRELDSPMEFKSSCWYDGLNWYHEETYQTTKKVDVTQYRKHTATNTYYFEQYSNWSSWSTARPSEASNRIIDSQSVTYYRYKSK